MAGRLHLGTSGFAYDEWKGVFYPPDVKQRQMLPFYASRFDSVEINYTFRKQPSPKTLQDWRDATPDGFVFSLKANQRITHWLRLADAGDAVAEFLETAKLLGPRLGPVLFQCPPTLAFDRPLVESFLATLPSDLRFAFEFRHPSWVEAKEPLRDAGAAWCVAETDDAQFTSRSLPRGPFAYLRLRKTSYEDEELRAWAARIRATLRGGRDVFCYFKHEDKGLGPRFADRLRLFLGG